MPAPMLTAGLSDADKKAYALSLQLDEYQKRAVYEEILLEKWSKVPVGDGSTFDWLGSDSESLGFPALTTEKAKVQVAMLLENQLRFNRSKRLRVNREGYIEQAAVLADTATGDEALPTTFALAMVRRAYAIMQTADWSSRQPMPGPTSFVWWIDFLRENDPSAGSFTNLLSNEYARFVTPEQAVPQKAKIALQRALVTANKQLLGTTWTLEASEDAMAQLGMNIEQEMISAFTAEFVRNRFHQHLLEILSAAKTQVPQGTNMPAPWNAAQSQILIPNAANSANMPAGSAAGLQEWARGIYMKLIDADVQFMRMNRQAANGIVCGLTLAGILQKAITATQSQSPTPVFTNEVGITDYGTFEGRFHVWGTDLLPDNEGFLYSRNPDTLRGGHIYAPYVPIQAMPAVYGGYDTTTGNYQNTDEYTRNIRERSASVTVKPYAFIPLLAA